VYGSSEKLEGISGNLHDGEAGGVRFEKRKIEYICARNDWSPDRVEDQAFLARGACLKMDRPVRYPGKRRWGCENRNNIRIAEK
jgi:hypothetical protein